LPGGSRGLGDVYKRQGLLEQHGFEIEKVEYIMAPMDVIKWKPLKNFLRTWVFNSDTTKIPFKSVSILVFCKRVR
jgi:hypothetical protein